MTGRNLWNDTKYGSCECGRERHAEGCKPCPDDGLGWDGVLGTRKARNQDVEFTFSATPGTVSSKRVWPVRNVSDFTLQILSGTNSDTSSDHDRFFDAKLSLSLLAQHAQYQSGAQLRIRHDSKDAMQMMYENRQ